MKILFYLHRYPAIGGIENVTTFLANAFVGLGYEIRIFSHFGVADRPHNLDGAIGVVRLDQGGGLRQEIKSWEPDLIIYQDSSTLNFSMCWRRGRVSLDCDAANWRLSVGIASRWLRDRQEEIGRVMKIVQTDNIAAHYRAPIYVKMAKELWCDFCIGHHRDFHYSIVVS